MFRNKSIFFQYMSVLTPYKLDSLPQIMPMAVNLPDIRPV